MIPGNNRCLALEWRRFVAGLDQWQLLQQIQFDYTRHLFCSRWNPKLRLRSSYFVPLCFRFFYGKNKSKLSKWSINGLRLWEFNETHSNRGCFFTGMAKFLIYNRICLPFYSETQIV